MTFKSFSIRDLLQKSSTQLVQHIAAGALTEFHSLVRGCSYRTLLADGRRDRKLSTVVTVPGGCGWGARVSNVRRWSEMVQEAMSNSRSALVRLRDHMKTEVRSVWLQRSVNVIVAQW